MSDLRTDEERGFVETALAAVDAGNAGSWPTVAGYLADEVRRLRAVRPLPTRERMVEAISARLHITTDTICDGGKPRHLSADTSAVYEAADAVLALMGGAAEQ